MLNCLCLLLRKDLTLLLRGQAWLHSLLFGLLLIFLFCLALLDESGLNALPAALDRQSLPAAQNLPTAQILGLHLRLLPTIFWLASIFFLLTLTVQIYAQDESNAAKQGLLALGLSPQLILVAKYLVCYALLLGAQVFFWLGLYVFSGTALSLHPTFLAALALGNAGLVALSCLLGPLAGYACQRQGWLALLFFTLALPVLLACLNLSFSEPALGPEPALGLLSLNTSSWLLLLIAFNCIFGGLALLLFPLLYKE